MFQLRKNHAYFVSKYFHIENGFVRLKDYYLKATKETTKCANAKHQTGSSSRAGQSWSRGTW